MSTHKNINKICVAVIVLSMIITVLFMNAGSLGIQASAGTQTYEDTLFDTSKVHTIDIIMDDWDSFIESAASEEYAVCSLVIDGETVKNAAIRGKGNTSLSTVASLNSERYSLKIEFDHYDDSKTYHGLDKLCLNNIIQDNTYMKDYLCYTMMNEFGVDSPLCSYVWVTVNGEDWGLYLAVEAVEESFMEREYGGSGDLYKPDSLSMGGGGPGNGRDFNMDDFMSEFSGQDSDEQDGQQDSQQSSSNTIQLSTQQGGQQNDDPSGSQQPGNGGMPNWGNGTPPDMPDDGSMPDWGNGTPPDMPEDGNMPQQPPGGFGGNMPGGNGGMGSDDVKLKYTDDDPDSYSNIFDNAKTSVTESDKKRLISSLKTLSEGTDVESVLDVDEVLRYFVVHNYVVNSDSYTGSMIHNYYLYENDGQLSMIPWDYNLAFGTFMGGSADSAVNDAIDSPLSVSGDGSRPMADWIYQSEEYTELYHRYFKEFLETVDAEALIEEAYELIAPYVEKDPTAFCTYEEFQQGVSTLKEFVKLRTESVTGQLEGTIPSTDEGRQAESTSLVDASSINLSDMGTMGGGKDGGMTPPGNSSSDGNSSSGENGSFGGMTPPSDGNGGFGGMTPPGGDSSGSFTPPGDNGNSGSFTPPSGNGSSGSSSGMPNMPGSMPGSGLSNLGTGTWIMLGVTLLVLIGGIIIAKLFTRRKRYR